MQGSIARRLAAGLPLALLATTALVNPASAACTSSADKVTLNCSGALALGSGLPITLYDAAAAFQPVNGSNSYVPANPAFPAASFPATPGYDPNPPTVTANFDSSVTVNVVNPASSALADRGLVVANYSNNESPAINNVLINNAGSIGLTTNQIASRMDAIVADSQVNTFTLSNSGTLSATQTFFSAFNAAKLSLTSSGTPATVAAAYDGKALNDIAALYADDNTNALVLNNAATGTVKATGNYATAVYGRADTTVVNDGTIAHTDWKATDTIAAGHWSLVSWGGADFAAAPNTNPDSSIVLPNADGSVTLNDTSALSVTNNAGATIKGDILALDVTPLAYAAAVGASGNPFPNPLQTTLLQLPVSNSNAGPKDSNIQNFGTINGNLYLGSGAHVIDNAAGANLNGSVYVDQRPVQVSFTVPKPGSASGLFTSAGGTDFNGTACAAAGADTDNAGCAVTVKQYANVVGAQTLTLTNEGALAGDIRIFDQATSNNSISLTGPGFTGNIVAVNGTGANSLTLDGVTQLASVNNFSFVDLKTSQVTMTANAATTTPGVTLVPNATLATTITGPGGTAAKPNSTNLGAIYGGLTLAGATTIQPTLTGFVRRGDVYQLASSVSGAGVSALAVYFSSPLVGFSADGSSGALLLNAQVASAATVPGLSKGGAAALDSLLSYGGPSAKVQGLGAAIEALPTAGAVRAAGEQIRPALNGASIQMPLAFNNLFAGQIFGRLDATLYGALAAPDAGARAFTASIAPAAPAAAGPLEGVWLNAAGSNITQAASQNISGYSADFGGFIAGYDHALAPGARIGAALGFAQGTATDSGVSGASLRSGTLEGLVYGSLIQDHFYFKGDAGVGGLNYQSIRRVSFDGFSDNASASRGGSIASAQGEIGSPIKTAFGTFVPLAALSFANISQAAYTESSAAGAGLGVAAQSTNSLQTGLGAQSITPFTLSPGWFGAFELSAVWRHEFLNTAESVTAAFAGGGSFQAVGPTPARDYADVGVGLRFAQAAGVSLDLSYKGQFGAGFTQQVAMAKARLEF